MYPNCQKDQQAILWEEDVDIENIKKVNKVQCLNNKCCGLVGKVYADWFYLIAT